MKRVALILLTIALTVLLLLPLSGAWAAPVNMNVQTDIENSLICQDNCGMLLSSCDNQTAQYMRKIISTRLAQGQSKEQIIGYFVNIYGTKVLAAPEAKGFNLTAWVTPFIAVILGGLAIYFAVDKWVLNAQLEQLSAEEDAPENAEELLEYEDKLEQELKKFL